MKTFQHLFFVVILTLSACASTDEMDPVQQDPVDDTPLEAPFEERLREIVDSKTDLEKLIGVTVSIRVGEEERWSFAEGISSVPWPMSKDRRFGIASITKTAVAATVLKLEEQGFLSLDDTIGDHLDLDSENIDPNISIFQLLNHFSGLKGYFQHPDIWTRVEANLETPIPPIELVQYIGEAVFEPGARYEYSNSNYLILGLIIEAVTGDDVGLVMHDKFWGPLNLPNVYFGATESSTGRVAAPWRDSNGDGQLENIADQYGPAYHSVFYTAADLFFTAEDLSMWAQHLFNGDALSTSSLTKMLNFVPIDSGSPYWDGYGLGVRRFIIHGREMYGHTGGMRGYGTIMLYDPISKVSIAILNNQSRSVNGPQLRFELLLELTAAVFEELN